MNRINRIQGQESLEDTWTGRLMFPVGIAPATEKRIVSYSDATALGQALDRPVIFLLARGLYSVYWCQTLSSVVLRVRAGADALGFELALSEAVDACLDTSVKALILDFRENSQIRYPLSTEELGLEEFGRHVIAVHPGYGENNFHDQVHLFGFDCLLKATNWLETKYNPISGVSDVEAMLRSNPGVPLVAANYSGCAYWLKNTMTLVLLYSGQEDDDNYAAALWVGISKFLEHLRATALILDIRHLVNMHQSLLQETSTAIEYLKTRGAEKFVLIGSRGIKPSANDPLEAHLEMLSRTSAGVAIARNLQQGLALVANPRRKRTLNS